MRNKLYYLILLITWVNNAAAQFDYPVTKKSDQRDDYFGTEIADPYRWLEDDRSSETTAWVTAQNKVTFDYLEKIPFRQGWLNRMEEINDYPKYSSPFRKQDYFYYYKNNGLQNQSVLYRQKGLDGKPETVIDPNSFSDDGTTSLALFNLSKDGRYAVVGKSTGGSDWRTFYIMDMNTLTYLPDSLAWVKVSGASWLGDGFFYSRYPTTGKGKELSAKNENHQVYYHEVGTSQDADRLIFEDKDSPLAFHAAFTDETQQYVFLTISDRSKKKGNALYYYDNKSNDHHFKPIIKDPGDYNYSLVTVNNGRFIISTNDGAKNGRVVAVDPAHPEKKNWKTIIPEQPENISAITAAGGKLFVTYFKDVTNRTYVYLPEGKMEREVKLPALGNVSGFSGERADKFVFYTFTSFTFPPTIYKYDIASGATSVFRKPEVKFNPLDFVTEQVFYSSKDGTKVPMFIVYKKDLKRNGKNPTMLYAYGGFNIPVSPNFNPSRISWLEQGGIYASANLRGGNEYGEKWHEAGMLFNKQNVFDDFIAAAEYLAAEKYTSRDFLSISGGSNGGLLVGAVINQRPELFKVALPAVGVMDMLRFHKFTIGFNWIAEYGSSENSEAEFKNLLGYSPLHNISDDKEYPAVLVTTADHDDRVVPAHSFKYISALQEKYKGKNPVMIRVDVNSGHGASNLKKGLETTADIYSFVFYNMGLVPEW